MRRLVLALSILAGLVVVLGGVGVAYLFLRYPDVPPPEATTVQPSPEKLARGEYLSKHVSGCVVCHGVRDYARYGGPVDPTLLGRGGESFGDPSTAVRVLFSSNITPTGIGSWTDGELIRAVTAGVSKDGRALFPIMPYQRYGRMSRDDVESIVAYLRTLPPLDYTAPPRELGMPLPLIVRTIPAAAQFRPIPPKTDRVAYGEYMANAAVCGDCHTPRDDRGAPVAGMEFAGGFEMALPRGGIVRAANLTPDADSGIGTWTEKQFIDKFKVYEGISAPLTPAEQRENTTMPWVSYAGMSRDDLSAIYAYLRSLRPVVNRVRKHY